jgi:hypothetical protein
MSASASYLTFIRFLLPIALHLICPIQGQNSFGVANLNENNSQQTLSTLGLSDQNLTFSHDLLRLLQMKCITA